jgi:hypothetical protein
VLVVLNTPISRSLTPTDVPDERAARGSVVEPALVFTPHE